MPIQQMLLGVGAKKKTYMDDVFSTYLHTGTGSSNSINNSINLSGEGGLVWIKQRNAAVEHFLFDTERGALKPIHSDANWAEYTANNTLTSFNSNGYTLGSSNYVNGTTSSPRNYTGFTFRKAPGFFDIVTYTGNVSSRTISHSLGCVPGMRLIKKTSGSAHWVVYHRGNADSNNAAHYAYNTAIESEAAHNEENNPLSGSEVNKLTITLQCINIDTRASDFSFLVRLGQRASSHSTKFESTGYKEFSHVKSIMGGDVTQTVTLTQTWSASDGTYNALFLFSVDWHGDSRAHGSSSVAVTNCIYEAIPSYTEITGTNKCAALIVGF